MILIIPLVLFFHLEPVDFRIELLLNEAEQVDDSYLDSI